MASWPGYRLGLTSSTPGGLCVVDWRKSEGLPERRRAYTSAFKSKLTRDRVPSQLDLQDFKIATAPGRIDASTAGFPSHLIVGRFRSGPSRDSIVTTTLPYDPVALGACRARSPSRPRARRARFDAGNEQQFLDAPRSRACRRHDFRPRQGQLGGATSWSSTSMATGRDDARPSAENAAAHADLPALCRRRTRCCTRIRAPRPSPRAFSPARRNPLRGLGTAKGDLAAIRRTKRARRAGFPEHSAHARLVRAGRRWIERASP